MSVAIVSVRRRRFDAKFVAIRTVPGANGHVHCAVVDDDGDGQTSEADDGHFHLVEGLEVLWAHGHRHEMSATRCEERHNDKANHVIPRRRTPAPPPADDEVDPRARTTEEPRAARSRR